MSFLNNIKFQWCCFCLLLNLFKQKLKSQHFTICILFSKWIWQSRREAEPKKLLHYCMSVGWWIPSFGVLIQGVEFLKKIFVRRRRTMKWHQINTKTRRNSRPHSADKKNKEKTSIKIGPRTVSFKKSTLCLPRCSWLSDTSIELYCVT